LSCVASSLSDWGYASCGQCVEQLEALRGEWKEWEARREAERERKMVLLGHGEWREKGN